MVQLQQILEDFQPLNYRENNAAKPDAAFLERTYNMIQTRVNNIISKRSADPAFYPLMQYMESRQGQQVSQFDESRMDYIIQKQQEFGGEIRLFTNDEVEALNENWSTMNALERSNYLKQMKEQSRRPELFGQMFSEMATGNNVRFSDQVYLEYADDTVVLKKIHATRNLSKGAISESLNMIQEDEQTLALALEDSDKLQDFLAAFNLNKNERFSMFEMVRKYVVGGVDKETSGLDDLVEQAMTDLVDKKYHIFNATPFEEDVEQFSILLPKNKIPDTPTQRPGLYRTDQMDEGPITTSQIGKGLMRFLKEDVPAMTTTDIHASLMSSENYFFQNSEDGQGLTLYQMTDSGLTKVGGSGTEIKLNFEKLFQYILEERVKVEPPSFMHSRCSISSIMYFKRNTGYDPLVSIREAEDYRPGIGTVLYHGLRESFDTSSIGLVQSLNRNFMARSRGNVLTESDWRSSQYYRPGLEYEEDMTDELAKVLAMRYDKTKQNEIVFEKTGALGAAAYFGSALLGALPDPINLVPFMALTKKTRPLRTRMTKNALGRVGVGAIEGGAGALALQPLLAADRLSHQERYDMKMAATDVLVGIGAGGLLTGAMEEAVWH